MMDTNFCIGTPVGGKSILRERYGTALRDLVPTDSSKTYLYGDRMSAPETVAEAKRKIFSDDAPGKV